VIAGPDDGELNNLKKIIIERKMENTVSLVGFLSEDEKIQALTDCDIFVHTARYMGGVGLVPLEAILCEKPVIVTTACGELIGDEGWGYVIEFGDKDSLKKTLRDVIENPGPGIEMAMKGRKTIVSNMTWDKVSEKIERIYEESLQSIKNETRNF
jgi:glycosyltransferase involved in cell wall biosynthesis